MKFTIAILILFMTVLSSFGQNKSDSIEIKKTFGTVYIQKGKLLTPRNLLNITQSNPEAYQLMKIANANNDVGFIFGFVGGLLVGWQLGTAIGGGSTDATTLGVGAGLILVSIPFSTGYTKHAKHAVRIYNSGLN